MLIEDKERTKSERATYWRTKIKEWLGSGQPIKDYCKEKGLSLASFYYWRNRLYPDYPKRSGPIKKDKKIDKKRFVAIKLQEEASIPEDLLLYYPNGCYIRIRGSFNPEVIIKINQAMGV